MTKTWKLEDAKAHLSQLIRDAEREPQVITRHGKPVALISPLTDGAEEPLTLPAGPAVPQNALDALRGDFDFGDFPDEDLFPRDRGADRRDLAW